MRISLTLIFLFSSLLINAQTSCDLSSFQKILGGASNDEGYSIALTTDGGSIISGNTQSFGAGNIDIYVIKLDGCGITEWTKTYGGANQERGAAILQTSDGGYIMAGYTQSLGAAFIDFLLIKTDDLGNVQWSNIYGLSGADYPRVIKQTPDGGYIIGGVTTSIGAGNEYSLFKVDASGTLQWTKTYGNSANDFMHDLEVMPDGGFILSGYRRDYLVGDDQAYLIRTDSTGNVQWAKTYSGFQKEIANTIAATANNGYLITGITNSFGAGDYDIMVINLDSMGNIIWSNTYGGVLEDRGSDVVQTPGGDFYILGTTRSYGSGGIDLYLMRIDNAGTVLSASTIGWTGDENIWSASNSMKLTPDGNVLIAGWTNSQGAGLNDVYIIKTDPLGDVLCTDSSQFPTVTAFAPTVLVNTPAVSSISFTQTAVVVPVSNPATIDSVICSLGPVCSILPDFTADTVCIGDSTSFIDLSTDSLNNIINWQWYFGDGDSTIGLQNPTHLYSTTGTFSVVLIVSNDDTLPCFDTIIKPVIVMATPAVSIAGNTIICSGDNTILTATGATNYLWNTGDTTASIIVNPSTTTTYSVTVSNGVCSAADSISVTVNSIPTVNITGNTSICTGDTTTLTASGGTSYLWVTGDTTASITVNPISTTTYSVTVSSGVCSAVDSISVTVNSLPTINITGNTTICVGDSAALTASGGISYFWNTGDTTATINVGPSSTTTYSVTIFDGCTNSDTVTVTVLQFITADAGADVSVCLGDSISLSASGGTSYSWSPVAGLNNPFIPNPLASPAVTTIYTVAVTNGSCNDVDSVVVTVLSLPSALAWPDSTICKGDTMTISASGAAFFNWSTGDSTANISIIPDSTTIYSVVVYDSTGCGDTASVLINVLNPPPAYAGEDTLICVGDSIALSASGGTSYLWNTNEATSVITVAPDTLTQYYVTVTDTLGCRGVDTVVVDVAVEGTAVANALPNGGCSPLSVNFINNSTPNDSSLYFLWDFGDPASGILNYDSVANPSHVYENPGTYSVILTITSGACSSIQAGSDTIIINVSSGPTANLLFDPDEATLLNSTVTFIDNSTGAVYCILITGTGDTLIPCNNSYTYWDAGTYTVTQIVYDALGCSDTMTGVIYIKPDYMLFAPNSFTPNGDGLNDYFLTVSMGVKTFELYIFNRWGDQIFESFDVSKGWDGRGNDGEFVAQNEVYVYRIYTIDYLDQKHEYVGKIILLR